MLVDPLVWAFGAHVYTHTPYMASLVVEFCKKKKKIQELRLKRKKKWHKNINKKNPNKPTSKPIFF